MNLIKLSKFSVMAIPLISAGTISLIPSINSSLTHSPETKKINKKQFFTNKNKQTYTNVSYQEYLNQTDIGDTYNRLGDGYDLTTGKTTGYSIFNTFNTNQPTVSIYSENSQGSFSCESSSTDLIKELGVSANLRFGFKRLSTSTSVNFFSKSETDSKSMSLVFDIKSSVDMRFNYNLDFNRIAENQINKSLSDGDWSNFQNMYSNKFIEHETARREVFVNLKISSSNISTTNKINASIGVKYGLASVSASINSLTSSEKNSLNINMTFLTLPGHGKSVIVPNDMPLTPDSFSKYIAMLESNSENFIGDYHTNSKNLPDNAGDWVPSAIDIKTDLMDYSLLDFRVKAINPYLDLMVKYPELNKYFDEAITLNEDSIYINKNKNILKPSTEAKNILPKNQNRIQEFSKSYEQLFSNSNELNELLDNHNETPILEKVKTLSDNVKNYSPALKIIDLIYHTSFEYSGGDLGKGAYIFDMRKIGNGFRLFIESNVNEYNTVFGSNFVFTEKQFNFNNENTKNLWSPDSIYVEEEGNFSGYSIKQSDFQKTDLGYSVETVKPISGIGVFYAESILKQGVFSDNLYDAQ